MLFWLLRLLRIAREMNLSLICFRIYVNLAFPKLDTGKGWACSLVSQMLYKACLRVDFVLFWYLFMISHVSCPESASIQISWLVIWQLFLGLIHEFVVSNLFDFIPWHMFLCIFGFHTDDLFGLLKKMLLPLFPICPVELFPILWVPYLSLWMFNRKTILGPFVSLLITWYVVLLSSPS